MAAKRKPDQVVRCFEVSNPTLHEKGHTVYKITQRLIRVDKQEEDVQELSVWRRYNDIKHLYKAMHKLHTSLHRKEEFPPFAEAKLFGRFDEDVIIERMRSAQDLLNFVGQRHYMVSHATFKRFFEGGELTKTHEPGEKLLKPHRVSKLSGDSDSDVSLSPTHQQGTSHGTSQGAPLVPEQAAAAPKDQSVELGGVWQYRQTGEDEELSLDGEEEENTDTDSVVSTPLPTDTNQFDPLTDQTPSAEQPVSNLWLLSSLQEEEEESPQPPTEAISFQVGCDGVEYGKGDLLVSPVPDAAASLPQNASPRRLAKPSSLLNLDLQDKGDYIVQAAKQISLAQHCEASNNYHLAFSYYKNGVGILLTGVQLDENETRREVVRRKTARYLIKAEDIHKQHLSQNMPSSATGDAGTHPNNRWDTGQLSPARELDPAIALLQGSFSELRHFKVLGILDSVMLVMDVNTDNTFVIKVLQKSMMDSPTSATARSAARRCLVRARGPYLVELYRFYDSTDVIYLLLQHAAGGRLWNYVGHFLQDQVSAIQELGDVYDHEKRLRAQTFDTEEGEEDRNREGDLDESKTGKQKGSNNNASRVERLDSALEDLDSVALDKNKDTVIIDAQLQHVQFDASKDNELLSPDTGHAQHSSSQLESQMIAEETESELNNTFQSLLEHTRKQALVGFAVDSSFESEDPPSRQLSNTIDGIEEEPTQSQEGAHLVDNVFITGSHEDGENLQASVKHSEDSEEEPSIYDNQPPYISDSDSEPVTLTNGANQIHKQDINTDSSAQDSNTKSSNADSSTKDSNTGNQCKEGNTSSSSTERNTAKSEKLESIPESSSDSNVATSPTPQPNVFRQVSRERSADSRRRKRALSGAFAELDLAGEEETEGKQQRLPEACVRQWVAELVVAVDALHQSGIICRDLNPANLLLGDRGHLLLSHFSVWSSVEPADPDMDSGYVAPEVSGCRPLSPACDWWSVGALLYELLLGRSLASSHPAGLSTHTSLHLPPYLSPEAASLLTQLLRVSPAERLTVLDIKTHAFFTGIDWHELEKY